MNFLDNDGGDKWKSVKWKWVVDGKMLRTKTQNKFTKLDFSIMNKLTCDDYMVIITFTMKNNFIFIMSFEGFLEDIGIKNLYELWSLCKNWTYFVTVQIG